MAQYKEDFIKILEHLKPSKSPYEIFNDWLVMTAATLYSWKQDASVEEEYKEIAEQYKKEEIEKHGELLLIVVKALEEKYQDFLGEIFTDINLSNKRNGQFFTPYHVSLLMAKITIGENLPQLRVCKVSDPCCGAGGLLIAGAQVMKEERGFNYQQNALFVAQDNDARCARMAFIQLSLLAMPAIVVCGNSLTFETYWQRETIGYYKAGMEYRLQTEALLENMKEISQVKQISEEEEKPVEIMLPSAHEYVQGELFITEEAI